MATTGALFTISGVDFSGIGIPMAALGGAAALFPSSLDLWLDFSKAVTTSGSNAASIRDQSGNGLTLTGSMPYSSTAYGAFGGVSEASGTLGNLQSAGHITPCYDFNQAFSCSFAFVYGGHPAVANVQNFMLGGWDTTSANGCGWSVSPGGSFGAGWGEKIVVLMKSADSSAVDGSYILVHGSTDLVAGTRYRCHVTYDGSGHASGVRVYLDGVAETMTVFSDTMNQTTWNLSGSGTNFNIGRNDGSAGYFKLMEVFTVDHAYSNVELAQAQSYLASKY